MVDSDPTKMIAKTLAISHEFNYLKDMEFDQI